MKFGLLLDTLDREEMLSLTSLATDEGFDSVWLDDAFMSPGGPGVTASIAASAVAATSTGARVGVITSLGLSNPVYTAEEVAVLDNISAGRTIMVIGPPSDRTALTAYGIDEESILERFRESLEICLLAWAPKPFHFEGQHFRAPARLPDNTYAEPLLSVTPKPAQPLMPVWLPAVSDDVVRTAADLGLPIVGPAADSIDDLRPRFELHGSLRGGPVRTPLVLIRQVDAGDVEKAIGEVESYRDELGIDYMICRIRRPGMAGEDVANAAKLLGRCLIPEFRVSNYPKELRSVSL